MTVLDESTLASADDYAKALFEEARRRRRRRWWLGTVVVVCALVAVGALYVVHANNGGGNTGGPTAGSDSLSRVPTGPTFDQPSNLPSSWVESTYRADGLLVTMNHPPSWTARLPGRGFHYADVWSFVANFPLNPHWCTFNNGVGGSGVACIWKQVGTFPKNGVLMTLGTGGYGPGPSTQALGGGKPISINGREARMLVFDTGQGCLGVGEKSSLRFTVKDGERQGEFNLLFCFSGPKDRVLQNEARVVVATLHMRPDPKAAGLENG